MSLLSKSNNESLLEGRRLFIKKSIYNGKNLKNKR